MFKSISGVIDQAMLRKEIESLLATPAKSGALNSSDKGVSAKNERREVSAVPS